MLLPKIGGVPAHPANVHRLLFDERQLVLVFPEGRRGNEKLYRDRYRLRRFGEGEFVEAAMRAGAPLVPVAVVGAEEAQPTFARLGVLQRLTGLLPVPVGMAGYLPAKFTIRFLEPVATDRWGPEPWQDEALVETVAYDIRRRIQENLDEIVGARQSVWFG
jgi:1-acyl-sn-glycerol-3-phosphate acyltransferase